MVWLLPFVAVVTIVAVVLSRSRWAALALRISRWTYALFVPTGLLYFPMQSGFRVSAPDCEWTFNLALAVYSLQNFAHIGMFAIFFVLTYAQLPNARGALAWSALACLVMGLLVELAEGATAIHHCRMRDLIPDMAGALAGAVVILAGRKIIALTRSRQTRA